MCFDHFKINSMRKRIAFISEHASPLAVLGGVDAGGQNVYVAELAKYLSKMDYDVDVFTRWEDATTTPVVNWLKNVRVIHVKAGPIKYVQKEELLPYMPEFRKNMMKFIEQEEVVYDLVHANFFMSALVAMELKEIMDIPYVVTYHALGKVRRIHQKEADKFPIERLKLKKKRRHVPIKYWPNVRRTKKTSVLYIMYLKQNLLLCPVDSVLLNFIPSTSPLQEII
jgi:D-inositol-3-phosphate glycosyltransferase